MLETTYLAVTNTKSMMISYGPDKTISIEFDERKTTHRTKTIGQSQFIAICLTNCIV